MTGWPARMRMFGGMAIGRTIAAESDPAFLTGSQMYPSVAGLYALLANAGLRLFERFYFAQMGAGGIGQKHDFPLFSNGLVNKCDRNRTFAYG